MIKYVLHIYHKSFRERCAYVFMYVQLCYCSLRFVDVLPKRYLLV